MCDPGEVLLYALSAREEVSWRNFRRYFDEVHRRIAMEGLGGGRESASGQRWQVIRKLSCLGHIDVKFDPQDITIAAAPPALAILPTLGPSEAVLCGARSPTTVAHLEEAAADAGVEVLVNSQVASSPYAPARVALRAEDSSVIRKVGKLTRLRVMAEPPARLLARISASVKDYIHGLEWSADAELNWHREDYDAERLRFQTPGETTSHVQLARYQSPITSVWRYRIWRAGESAEVRDLDWARYASLAVVSRQVLRYDEERRDVLVHFGAPLPTLLARALGLCSGLWPGDRQLDCGGRFYAFRDVPPSIFEAVAIKLGHIAK